MREGGGGNATYRGGSYAHAACEQMKGPNDIPGPTFIALKKQH